MNLNVRYPIDSTYIPRAIAHIIHTGGVRFSEFQTALINQSKHVPGQCKFCLGSLDSYSRAYTVFPYHGQNDEPCYTDYEIVTTPPCNHEFHSGCLFQAVRQDAGMSKCPVCDTKWFDDCDDLYTASIIQEELRRLWNGEFYNSALFITPQVVRLNVIALEESLLLAAYAIRGSQPSVAVIQHGRDIVEAMMLCARGNDGQTVGTDMILNTLSGYATWIIYNDPQKAAHQAQLLTFASIVITWAVQHYMRQF